MVDVPKIPWFQSSVFFLKQPKIMAIFCAIHTQSFYRIIQNHIISFVTFIVIWVTHTYIYIYCIYLYIYCIFIYIYINHFYPMIFPWYIPLYGFSRWTSKQQWIFHLRQEHFKTLVRLVRERRAVQTARSQEAVVTCDANGFSEPNWDLTNYRRPKDRETEKQLVVICHHLSILSTWGFMEVQQEHNKPLAEMRQMSNIEASKGDISG